CARDLRSIYSWDRLDSW
nr:immunoglobulin heavy chain junction region [Macaca mulatta]